MCPARGRPAPAGCPRPRSSGRCRRSRLDIHRRVLRRLTQPDAAVHPPVRLLPGADAPGTSARGASCPLCGLNAPHRCGAKSARYIVPFIRPQCTALTRCGHRAVSSAPGPSSPLGAAGSAPATLHENEPFEWSWPSEDIVFGSFFNAGVRAYDVRDPFQPRQPLSICHMYTLSVCSRI